MAHSILITQSLQNDFVKPIGPYDELPNLLHIGYREARRIMGEDPEQGPIARVMKWAYKQPPEDLSIIHIRDLHDGDHSLGGADFAFPVTDESRPVSIIDPTSLSDFKDTGLSEILNKYSEQEVKIGLTGVWTEAKIFFLAYELKIRFPNMSIALCSALTAGSSKINHINALDQLERLLGVKVISSIGEFTKFLMGEGGDTASAEATLGSLKNIEIEGIKDIDETDRNLIQYLFRDSKKVQLKELLGGYSGNLVFISKSEDIYGHQQVPHVVKIGKQGEIGKERMSFERIENVLGDIAPQIADFADLKGRGAIKYRYAAMGGGTSATFKDLFEAGMPLDKAKYYLDVVFKQNMSRFYKVAAPERINLLKYYLIESSYAPRMKEKVEMLTGSPADGNILKLPTGQEFPNPYIFYSKTLDTVCDRATGLYSFSFIHGDLNGSNVLIDEHDNVWIIDFFFTGRGHAIRDLIKFENDLLYFFTPVNNEDDLKDAIELSNVLLEVEDLYKPLPPVLKTGIRNKDMIRSYEVIRHLRSFYPGILKDSRNILQLLIGQLRYAGRTMTYIESNKWQKLWALYVTGHLCEKIGKKLESYGPFRVDWLDKEYTSKGSLGMTIMPGRKDRNRSLEEDLKAIKAQKVSKVLVLVTSNEFSEYGVEGLMDRYKKEGIETKYFPMLNHSTCSIQDINDLVDWISENLDSGEKIMVHCVGGLGRSGFVAAAYLIATGMPVKKAIRIVRDARSPNAIEPAQAAFLERYGKVKQVSGDDGKTSGFNSVDDILDMAIQEESEAVELYKQLVGLSSDPEVKRYLKTFILEEAKHLAQFKKIKKEGAYSVVGENAFASIEKDAILKEVEEARQNLEVGPGMSLEDAFKFAIIKEKGAYLLYTALAEKTENAEIKSLLEFFALEEAKHKIQFEVAYEKLKKANKV